MTRRLRGPRSHTPSAVVRRRSLLVFTEGEKTETIYIQHWHRRHRDRVIVTVSS
ncbi:hypothetical protein SAMN05421505_105190 [Sinosporangium album]|uniref:Uncharacterized protein n=1 Tax=Sinosporangium album TaxID=504805 RepID=A0A1G7VA64_9ACTN|nr:RloB domain-containing protein [Sinosporangium album]SDG56686.1 hypothetical protein SAMN05421505_105190 [Sinosporangium album]